MEKLQLIDGEVRGEDCVHYVVIPDSTYEHTYVIDRDGCLNADNVDQAVNGDNRFTPSFKHLRSLVKYCRENNIKHNIKLQTKGFVSSTERNTCEFCRFLGGDRDVMTECTKLEIPFYVLLEDSCDEFEERE